MTAILPRTAWTSAKNGRAGRPLSPSRVKGITLHWPTGGNMLGLSQSQVAEKLRWWRAAHVAKTWADIGYNYAVDGSGRKWYLTGLNVGAHAGGTGAGNTDSVGIVLVIGEGEEPNAAMIQGVKELHAEIRTSMPQATKIYGHRDWVGTECPGDAVYAAIKAGTFSGAPTPSDPIPQVAVWDLPSTWKIGSTGPAVTKLGQRLVIHAKELGLPAPYKQGPGPEFTETDRVAVAAFQRAQGWTGADADGFPGAETFRRLAADPQTDPDIDLEEVTVLSLNVASKNAAVNKQYGPWSKRAPKVAAFVIETGADLAVFQELYAAQRVLLHKLLAGHYWFIGVKGGRAIYKRVGSPGVPSGGSIWTDMLPGVGTKYAVARKFSYPSGAELNLYNAHLSYETTAAGVKKRAKEVPSLIGWARKKFPTGYDLFVGDFNSPAGGTTRRDDVGPIFTKFGLRDLGLALRTAVGRGRYHLDRAFGGLIRAIRVRVLPTDFTDHPALLITVGVPTK